MESWELDEESFVTLLKGLVGVGEKLQNWPPNFIPEEDVAADQIVSILEPFKEENGGALSVKHIHIQPEKFPKRGNIIIQYPANAANDSAVVSFVGSHLDVVYANRAQWEKNPFELIVEGDKLHGRGTTDCLGHCALLTNLFVQLATKKPNLNGLRVVGVIICDEEAGGSIDKVGVEGLQEHHYLDSLVNGPLIWLDCADKQPNVGSGGVVQWSLEAIGKLTHSGFPQKAVNPIELANDAIVEIQKDFYKNFPVHPNEAIYGFESTSSIKPTYTKSPDGSINQIPGEFKILGDIRLIPFYKIREAMRVVEETVARLNTVEALENLQGSHGPNSKYVVRDASGAVTLQGKLNLTWLSEPIQGLACKLDSPGFKALDAATKKIVGFSKPIADTGSLPLVADLQTAGFDVQTVGYGVEDAYHADNEYALLSDYKQGFQVLCSIISQLTPQ